MANMIPPGGRPQSMKDESVGPMGPMNQMGLDPKMNLATFIYDFFLKKGKVELANAMISGHNNDLGVRTRPRQKKSPNNNVNGMDDPMDFEKDEIAKKTEGLPEADIQEYLPKDSFLEEWWVVFWDIWSASKQRKASPSAQQYLQSTQNRQVLNRNIMQQNLMRGGMGPNMRGMSQQDVQRAAMNNQQRLYSNNIQMRANMANLNPQQQAALQQQQSEMAGQQRPQSPMSGDAPSPKRPRVDGAPSFGSNQMTPNMAGQARPGGVPMPNGPGQQPGMSMPNGLEMPNAPFGMAGNPQNRMAQFGGMNQKFPGVPKDFNGSNGDMSGFEDINTMFPDGMRNGGLNGPPGSQQGGALADYQMQLMLLEQQNKKRLLMARQEQEVTSQGGGGPPGATQGPTMMGAGPGAPFQQSLSPRRNGQSPSPNDPSKRASSGGFDPNQMGAPGMTQQFFANPMGAPGGMRPGGAPNFPGGPGGPMAMEQLQRARAMGPGSGWPGAQGMQPGNMPGQQQGPGNQQQNPMPPPSAPNPGPNAARTNPSSPAPGANPPTPQQQPKSAPANKNTKKDNAKENKKSKPANKKGGAANANATPSTEAESANGPPTPTPPTPVTPSAPNNPFKNGPGPAVNGQNNGQPAQPQPHNMPGHQQEANGVNIANPFGSLGAGPDMQDDNFGGLDFNVDNNDVLEGFDFDSFLNTGTDEGGFGPDFNFMGGDGNEMGVRDV